MPEKKPIKPEEERVEDKKPIERSIPDIKPGMTIRIHQKIKEINPKGEEKERIQIFEGIVLAKSGKGISSTFTVRKISEGIGVEKILPLNLPTIVKIEIIKQARVRRAKLYYLRNYKKKMKDK